MVRAVSDNNANPEQRAYFTPASATQMLPLVRRIVRDILRLQNQIDQQAKQLEGVDQLPETIQQADYVDEVSDIRSSLAEDRKELDECIEELNSLGVELQQPLTGAVAFPSEWNRKPIRLCWRPDEEKVMYFHEPGQTMEDRQKIDPQWFSAESFN
ncbi:MAG: DUF2203 domain-containing protein [Planctomycetota bacterium]